MKEFTETMSQNVDFLHPRIHNNVVLGCIYHVASSVVTALYDGVSSDDLAIVIMELCKMCVLCSCSVFSCELLCFTSVCESDCICCLTMSYTNSTCYSLLYFYLFG